jgi:hypothetical protein
MGIKLYNSSTWDTQKSLKLYAGSLWNAAKQGWVYNGSSWNLMYPEYPLNTTAPAISGNTSIGSTLTTTDGTWTSTDAYSPVSYSYQWKRGVTSVGSNQNTYVTVSGDAGSDITCQVSAINQRGSTPVTSSNSISVGLPAPASLSVSDSTLTPGNNSVSATGGYRSWTASWSAASNATQYYISQSPAVVGDQTFVFLTSGFNSNGSNNAGGSITIQVWGINNNGRINASWSAVSGATSYNVSWSGDVSGSTTTSSTSTQITINVPFGATRAITVSVAGVVGSAVGSSISSGISLPSKYTISGSATANVSL